MHRLFQPGFEHINLDRGIPILATALALLCALLFQAASHDFSAKTHVCNTHRVLVHGHMGLCIAWHHE